MKKLLALVSSLVICLSFAACGSSDESSVKESESKVVAEASSEEVSEEISEESAKEIDSEILGAEYYASVQEFIDDNSETFAAYIDALDGTGMKMEISARGNALVYSYQYTDMEVENNEELKTALETSINAQEETFKQVLSSIQLATPTAESIIVEYFDNDGKLITSIKIK